jgi:uroporphyrinogen-III decarboxylase
VKAVLDAIRLLRARFGDEVGIIGKAYGPWSLAYHTFGIEPFLAATLLDPGKVTEILRRLVARLQPITSLEETVRAVFVVYPSQGANHKRAWLF